MLSALPLVLTLWLPDAYAFSCAVLPINVTTRVVSPTPAQTFEDSALPLAFDWRNVNGENMVTTDRTQSTPVTCDACWAFAVTHTLSDRIKIARKGAFPEVNIGTQLLLTCQQSENGCHGGAVLHAVQWISENGITDETCSPFIGRGRDTGEVCLKTTPCYTCDASGSCSIPDKYDLFFIDEFGTVTGEQNMQKEIRQRGPIVCHFNAPSGFRKNYKGGIYSPQKDKGDGKLHAVEVAGWGVADDGTKYWIGRNSWGAHWGESGWFRIERGRNTLGIEENCVWFTPQQDDFKDWTVTPRLSYLPPDNSIGTRTNDVVSTFEGSLIGGSSVPARRGSVHTAEGEVQERFEKALETADSHLRSLKLKGSDVDVDSVLHGRQQQLQNGAGNDGIMSPPLITTSTVAGFTGDGWSPLSVMGPLPSGKACSHYPVGHPDHPWSPSKRGVGIRKSVVNNLCTTNPGTCSVDPTCQCDFGFRKSLDIAEDGRRCFLCVPMVNSTPSVLLPGETLPENFDWRDVNGKNYLTFTRNQHNPSYCGGCWAFATTSCLGDRLNIMSGNTWPNKAISPQVLINCRGGGDCYGGDQLGVYDFIFSHGLPHDTCQTYHAKNYIDFHGWCPKDARCMECGAYGDDPDSCQAVPRYRNYKVRDFGRVKGNENIKTEILKRGPVTCGVDATRAMDDYAGGIFKQKKPDAMINHEVALVGWGVDDVSGEEYWIMRNSWGTFWGERGFMRIAMNVPDDENNLISTECSWSVPESADGELVENIELPAFEAGTVDAMFPSSNVWTNPVDLRPVDKDGHLVSKMPSYGADPQHPSKWPDWMKRRYESRVEETRQMKMSDASSYGKQPASLTTNV